MLSNYTVGRNSLYQGQKGEKESVTYFEERALVAARSD
jgi:hypothetical protein